MLTSYWSNTCCILSLLVNKVLLCPQPDCLSMLDNARLQPFHYFLEVASYIWIIGNRRNMILRLSIIGNRWNMILRLAFPATNTKLSLAEACAITCFALWLRKTRYHGKCLRHEGVLFFPPSSLVSSSKFKVIRVFDFKAKTTKFSKLSSVYVLFKVIRFIIQLVSNCFTCSLFSSFWPLKE